MATVASGAGGAEERAVFVRKATGLVRGWSVRDAFIYATFAINLVTLGWYIFAFAPYTVPGGGLLWAVIVGGAYLIFQAITYASLIAAMPRAGGDYVWMSRVLGGGVGFVLACCGWWFILWHWVPIYAFILQYQVLQPLSAIVGWHGGVTFWTGDTGIFVSSIITALLASGFIALGIRTYARIQKFCFYGGMFGLAVMAIILLVSSKTGFIHHFNTQAAKLYGTKGNAYAATLKAGTDGYKPVGIGTFNFNGILLLIPLLFFFNLWSNWGATLYGEVRGASDFRKNIYAMGGALLFTTGLAVIFFLLFAKTFGWNFYEASNYAYSGGPLGVAPYPGTFAAFLLGSRVLQFIFICLLTLWFVGWVGSVFLSSTRVVFAAAFDRVLPEWAASVSNGGVPYWALALMLLPSIPISALYAYSSTFHNWTLDATLVIAITFLGTTVSAAILPWRKPEIYNASPIAKYKVLGLPLITFAALLFGALLIWALIKWLSDSIYAVNNSSSLIYMACLYALALAIYVISRLVRRRQGMDLGLVYGEIPVE
jgi:basic amino acid/polyamine antiporter, APA family